MPSKSISRSAGLAGLSLRAVIVLAVIVMYRFWLRDERRRYVVAQGHDERAACLRKA